MLNSVDIIVWFQAEKLEALKRALEQTGSNVEQELEKSLDALYEQNVPLNQRTAIASKIAAEEKRCQEELARQVAEQYRVSIVCVNDGGVEHCWKLERSLDVLAVATHLRRAMRQSDKQIAGCFEQRLGEKESITPDEVIQFTAARSQGDIHVSGVFSADFEEQVFTLVEPKEQPRQYRMKDISTAIFHASRKQGISNIEKTRRFWKALENKQVEGGI